MNRLRILGAATASVAAALALAACGGGSGTTTGTTGATVFNQGTTSVIRPSTHRGGTIIYDDSSTPDSTDPGNTYYAFMWNFSRLYATPLMTYKSCPGTCGEQIVPALATAPGVVSNGGLTWTYTIQSGLKFSNGDPITSTDVKYAVERTFAKDVLPNGPGYFKLLLGGNAAKYLGPYKDKSPGHLGLTAVTTPTPTTVVFHLAKPFADFNYVVAIPQTAPVDPKVDLVASTGGANYQLNPISTGPYMFQSYTLNKQFTLVDNPNWVPTENPQAKQLAAKIIVNLNVSATKIDSDLLAGNIQMDMAGTGVQTAARARILSNNALKANADDPVSGFLYFIYVNTKIKPLNNVACRRAVEYAVNKTEMQTAFGGPYAGGAIASTSMPPNIVGYKSFDLYEALAKPGGDVTAAKAQLKTCGQPNGFSVNIGYRTDRPKEAQAAQFLQHSLSTVGIKAGLKAFTSGTYYSDFCGNIAYNHSHDVGLCFGGWGADWPDFWGWFEYIVGGNAIAPAGNTNIGELNDPVVNNLLASVQKASYNPANNPTIAQQIDMQVMKDANMVPEVYAKALLYRSPQLTNIYVQAYYGQFNYAVLGVKG